MYRAGGRGHRSSWHCCSTAGLFLSGTTSSLNCMTQTHRDTNCIHLSVTLIMHFRLSSQMWMSAWRLSMRMSAQTYHLIAPWCLIACHSLRNQPHRLSIGCHSPAQTVSQLVLLLVMTTLYSKLPSMPTRTPQQSSTRAESRQQRNPLKFLWQNWIGAVMPAPCHCPLMLSSLQMW